MRHFPLGLIRWGSLLRLVLVGSWLGLAACMPTATPPTLGQPGQPTMVFIYTEA